MKRCLTGTALLLCLLMAASPAEAGRWWFGGGIGLGFGDRDFFEVSGVVGYQATSRFTPGARLTYRNREISRSGSKFTTDDYGGSLFARYRVWKPIYAQIEYEVLSYEFVNSDLSIDRDTFGSLLGGGGVSLALSRNLSFFAAALYNFSYEADEIRSPYSNEWIVRSGIGYSF